MNFYADLHIHSKYARATSRNADLENMALWASQKGIDVIGTGDFTHPAWFAEIQEKLVPAEPGLFRLRPELEKAIRAQLPASCEKVTRFMLEVEISTIYKKGEKTRKVHHLIYVPDLEGAGQLIQRLGRIGNLKADGRPILGLDSRDLLEITLECGKDAYLIPAHIWTPWFAALGSKSGFDSIEECYGDLSQHIFAVETGLSSDPPMNRRLSQLDRYQLVSNSDAHSPAKIGREACVFETDMNYFAMREALETGKGYGGTIEFFPEEGKYHMDGCRKCGLASTPEETLRNDGLCPGCGKAVTVGVMHRVAKLADRVVEEIPEEDLSFRSFVTLPEILSEINGVGVASKKVQSAYFSLINQLGSEFFILEQAPLDELEKAGSPLIAEGIRRMRDANVITQAGYDGEYGVIRLFSDDELTQGNLVGLLFDLPPSIKPTQPQEKIVSEAVHERQESVPEREPLESSIENDTLEDTPFPLLNALDRDQRAAASVVHGPLMIVAGPGTGKTRTLTHRIAHLIKDHAVAPEQCLAVTFTNRAAKEMAERLCALLPDLKVPVAVMTFHGLAYQIIKEHGNLLGLSEDVRLASEVERSAMLKELLAVSEHRAKQLIGQISRYKHQAEGDEKPLGIEEIITAYDKKMRELNWLDFDDLVSLAVQLFSENEALVQSYRARYRWISIDEYQDIDPLQYRLVRYLAPPEGNFSVIGDPDQSIYSFRGTDVRFFQSFHQDYPTVHRVQLRRNYRSTTTIVEGALQCIAPTTLVADRHLKALNRENKKIVIHEASTDRAEAEFVVHTVEKLIGGSTFFSMDSGRVTSDGDKSRSFSDFAVLYRTTAQAQLLCEAFSRSGIPFQRRSHTPLIEWPETRFLLERMTALGNTRSVIDRLKEAARDLTPSPEGTELTLMSALEPVACRCGNDSDRFLAELTLGLDIDLWDPRAECVSLLTLHASKGLEFPIVFVIGCEQGILPLGWGGEREIDNIEEERRLFFVGMTRAEESLYLTHARKRFWRGQMRERQESPFIGAIEKRLMETQLSVLKPQDMAMPEQLKLF